MKACKDRQPSTLGNLTAETLLAAVTQLHQVSGAPPAAFLPWRISKGAFACLCLPVSLQQTSDVNGRVWLWLDSAVLHLNCIEKTN